MEQNKSFIYKAIPQGWPVPGQDLTIETSDFDTSAAPPKDGVTTKNFYAAFDPSQRGRMRDSKIPSYSPAMEVGKPVLSVSVIGKVLKSDNSNFKQGDIIMLPFRTESYSAIPESALKSAQILDPPKGVPLTSYLGALGMTGLTAHGSLKEIGNLKRGETIWISGAGGAVGQMVGQLALLEGLKVIGSVSNDRKAEFLTKELGFTGTFNYKTESYGDALKRLVPDGLDIFYDNVGGEALDAALLALKTHGRIIASGAVSQYNNKPDEGYGVKYTALMIGKRLKWQGFLVLDPNITQHKKDRDEKITKYILDGSLKTTDHVTVGMDNAINGFLGMLKGENLGKSILKIADPNERT